MDDILIGFGSELKLLPNGHIGGHLVRFTSKNSPDLAGDYFDANTDFGFDGEITSPVYLNHRLPLETSDGKKVVMRKKIGMATLTKGADGILIDAILYERKKFEKALGAMGWSSGTAKHLTDRTQTGKSFHVDAWPLGLDASITPNPCDPDNVCSLKSFADAGGVIEIGEDVKSVDDDDSFFEVIEPEVKTQWTREYVDSLPDSCFAFIEQGGTLDSSAKTLPRSMRYFAYKSDNGKLDEAQVRASLAIIPVANLSDAAKSAATAIISRAAKTLGIEVGSGKSLTFTEHFLSVVTAVEDHTKTAGELIEDVETLSDRIRERLEFRETKDGRTISSANRDRLSSAAANLETMMAAMKQVHSDLLGLMQMAAPKPKDKLHNDPVAMAKAASEAAIAQALKFEELSFNLAMRQR